MISAARGHGELLKLLGGQDTESRPLLQGPAGPGPGRAGLQARFLSPGRGCGAAESVKYDCRYHPVTADSDWRSGSWHCQ